MNMYGDKAVVGSLLLLVSGLAAGVASAVDTSGDATDLEEITITGSRIVPATREAPVPVLSVEGSQLMQSGHDSVGDWLNDLPALRSTFGQSNSSRFLGTAGLNLLDLRGLGTERTLVLVNGRRHVGSDSRNTEAATDINTLPSELIERVDVVTGGSSAVYGSDAIAGVVNFVLRKNFDGLQVHAQSGQSRYSDGRTSLVSVLGGTDFAAGRGNVMADLEYTRQQPIFASNRPNLAAVGNFVVVDSDPAGSVQGSDGVADRTYYSDIRSVTLSTGGLLQITPATGLAPCGRDKDGAAYRCTYLFQPDGTIAAQTGTRIGLAPNGNFVGGNGITGREGDTLGVIPELQRVNLNLVGHYEVSPALKPFLEVTYARTDSIRYSTPAFIQGTTLSGDVRERPLFDNPFLSDVARTAINAARAANGLAAMTASTRLTLFRNLNDLGGRKEDARRQTVRLVAGLEGSFADHWHYETSLNYGQFDESTRVLNNVNDQRFLLALDAARDSAGNIVCRSKIDPAAAQIYPGASNSAYAQSLLAADVAACVPLNLFGPNSITPAMRNYVIADTTTTGRIRQFDVSGFVSGDSRQWFSLPAGPVGIAFGGEYRRESNYFSVGELVANGLTFYNGLPLFDPPAFGVKEAFTELRVPLLKDLPAFRELTLTTAGRLSSYDGNVGTVHTYNADLEWAPVADLRLRAGVGRAIRAPFLTDLYPQQLQNFATVVDPCSARNIATGSATRAANCRAAGIPASYDYVYSSGLLLISGGNPNLKAESSDSVTAGFVLRPSAVPALSLSADYFDIKVKDVIGSPTAQQILNACYDAPSLANQFCSLFARAGSTGGARGEIPFQILEGSLKQIAVNYARRTARGVDLDGSYRLALGAVGTLNSRLIYTHMLERANNMDPVLPGLSDQSLLELGDPKDAVNLSLALTHGKATVTWNVRYLGKMVLNQYEDTYSVQSRPPQNVDYADVQFYPSATYHNLRLDYDVSKIVKAQVGVDNLSDRQPPFGLAANTEGGGIYDVRGRFYYLGVRANLR